MKYLKLIKNISSIILLNLLVYNAEALICNTENIAIKSTTPTADFIVNSDGTATHIKTGLMWMRCGLGQVWTGTTCTGTPSFISGWGAALRAADQSTFANRNDWRLPNKNELASITELRCSDPAINLEVFPGTMSVSYFTSSQHVNWDSVVAIYFGDGTLTAEGKISNVRVRLVRGGL